MKIAFKVVVCAEILQTQGTYYHYNQNSMINKISRLKISLIFKGFDRGIINFHE